MHFFGEFSWIKYCFPHGSRVILFFLFLSFGWKGPPYLFTLAIVFLCQQELFTLSSISFSLFLHLYSTKGCWSVCKEESEEVSWNVVLHSRLSLFVNVCCAHLQTRVCFWCAYLKRVFGSICSSMRPAEVFPFKEKYFFTTEVNQKMENVIKYLRLCFSRI